MEFIISYWYLIIAAIAVIVAAGIAVYVFLKSPRGEQLEKVKEWLLYAVTEAERAFGSSTGQIKLRYVYDMFLTKFPFFAKFLSFEKFSELVDDALRQMRHLVETNIAVQTYVTTGPAIIVNKQ